MIGVASTVLVQYIRRVIISIGNSSSNSYVPCGTPAISSKTASLRSLTDIRAFST